MYVETESDLEQMTLRAKQVYADVHQILGRQYQTNLENISIVASYDSEDNATGNMHVEMDLGTLYVHPEGIKRSSENMQGVIKELFSKDEDLQAITDYMILRATLHELGHVISFNTDMGRKLALPIAKMNQVDVIKPIVEPFSDFVAHQYIEDNLSESDRISFEKLHYLASLFQQENSTYKLFEQSYREGGADAVKQKHDILLYNHILQEAGIRK